MRVGRPLPAGPRTLEFQVPVISRAARRLERLAGSWVEEQRPGLAAPRAEVEHVVQRACDGVEGTADCRQLPVVLDELEDGTLVADRVGHEVALGPGRDDQQRQPW